MMSSTTKSNCLAWLDFMYLKCKVCENSCQLQRPILSLIIKYRKKKESDEEWKQLIGDIESESKKAQR